MQTFEEIQAQKENLRKQLQEIEKQEKMLQNKELFEIWQLVIDKQINVFEFQKFVNEQIDEATLLYRYTYKNDKNEEKTFEYRDGTRGRNPFKTHCEAGKLTYEQALAYARNEAGKKVIAKYFNRTYEAPKVEEQPTSEPVKKK